MEVQLDVVVISRTEFIGTGILASQKKICLIIAFTTINGQVYLNFRVIFSVLYFLCL